MILFLLCDIMGIKNFSVFLKSLDSDIYEVPEIKTKLIAVDISLLLHQALFTNANDYLDIIFNKLLIILGKELIPICVFDGTSGELKINSLKQRAIRVANLKEKDNEKTNVINHNISKTKKIIDKYEVKEINYIDLLAEKSDDDIIKKNKIKENEYFEKLNKSNDIKKNLWLIEKIKKLRQENKKIICKIQNEKLESYKDKIKYSNIKIRKFNDQKRKITNKGYSISELDIKKIKQLLDYMGLYYIQAEYEADKVLAYLSKNDLVYGVISDDSDILVLGGKYLFRFFYKTKELKALSLEKILKQSKLSYKEFVNLCALMGCDYCNNPKGIGAKTGYNLIKENHKLENLKYDLKDNIKARDYFLEELEIIEIPKIKKIKENPKLQEFCKENIKNKDLYDNYVLLIRIINEYN